MILLFMLVVKGSLIPPVFILFFKFHIDLIKASHGIFENYARIEGYDYIGEYAN